MPPAVWYLTALTHLLIFDTSIPIPASMCPWESLTYFHASSQVGANLYENTQGNCTVFFNASAITTAPAVHGQSCPDTTCASSTKPSSDDKDSYTPIIIAAAVLVVLLLLGIGVWAWKRKKPGSGVNGNYDHLTAPGNM